MPADYYDDSTVATGVTDDTNTAKTPEERDTEQDEKTALIPSALCPGLKPGDTLKLRVSAVHEDEYEVEYDEGDAHEDAESPEEEAAEHGNPPSMGGYMED